MAGYRRLFLSSAVTNLIPGPPPSFSRAGCVRLRPEVLFFSLRDD